MEVAEKLARFKSLKAVYGNIDDFKIRAVYPKIQTFDCEGMNIIITHIGGYPGHYAPGIQPLINIHKPGLFIAGHSHILKVINDKKNNLLHINPGAAGNNGFHQVKTAVRFTLEGAKISGLEIWESPRG
jgi:predicted phosphodiesterase